MNTPKRAPKIEIYADHDGDWRWQVIAANGRVVGVSSEGYRKRADCIRGAHLTCQAILALTVIPASRAIN